jgi:N-acetylmuramoyl-L-alanine amidase
MEKDVALDVALRAAKLLRAAGATVLLTRCDDTFIPMNDRPALANTRHADIFVAIHCNSTPKPNTASGTQTYFNTPQSAPLADCMQRELVKGLALPNGGVRTAGYLVIRKSLMPAVLLELAFINNLREEALLATPDFRETAAEAVVNGIRRYAAGKEWQGEGSNAPEPTTLPASGSTE